MKFSGVFAVNIRWQLPRCLATRRTGLFPAMRAAASLNIPIIVHEQNAVLGRVNRTVGQVLARPLV